MYWFKGDDPLVVRIVDRLFVELVNGDHEEMDDLLAKQAAQYNARYGKVSERFGPYGELESLVCAFRFNTEMDMLAFVLTFK